MDDSMEYLAKVDGQGDGLKKITIRKRNPVQSSRKFNARTPRDEGMKLKLEEAITQMKVHPRVVVHSCIAKANTIAEITPTKNKSRKKLTNLLMTPSNDGSSSDVTLFATPRPFDDDLVPKRCTRARAVCLVYQRLMLCAWRRYRQRVKDLNEIYNQQKCHANQLELQVEVLSSLRNSESEKRHEVQTQCQNLKLRIDQLVTLNENLEDELKNTRDLLDNTKANLFLTKEDLQHCSEQLKRVQGQLKKKMEEKMDIVYKLTDQQREMQIKDAEIKNLENKLKVTELNLQNCESNYKIKQEEMCELFEQFQTEVGENQTLNKEIENLKEQNFDFEQHCRILEDELSNYVASCEQLTVENVSMKNDLDTIVLELEDEKKRWYQRMCGSILTRNSLGILRRIGEVVVPMAWNRGVYF